MKDPKDTAESRTNLACWLIRHSVRLQLDLRLIRFLDDGVEVTLALLPRDIDGARRSTYHLTVDYALGMTDAEHVIEEELRFALCELQKQQMQKMGIA